LKEEEDTRAQAPKVLKDDLKTGGHGAQNAKPSTTTTTRSFSTFARRQAPETTPSEPSSSALDPSMIPTEAQRTSFASEQSQKLINPNKNKSHKFPLPPRPLPPNSHLKRRNEPIVDQLTTLMMLDGKKAQAQRIMSVILSTLRTSPAPTYSATRPLLPGAPPAAHLPLHPVLYLTLAIDSLAPLLRIRSQRGAAGGGVALQIPVPLGLRQRRRVAFNWILDAASKKKGKVSAPGVDGLGQRIAEEIIGVVEGKSSAWEKREAVHRLGTTARSNLNFTARGRR
jgi:small subunit ribosomal protein S7